jgi:hypothetical protein
MSQDVAFGSATGPKALEELQVPLRAVLVSLRKPGFGKYKIESSNPHNFIPHIDRKIGLPAWQFVCACPTVTKFYLLAAFAVDYFSVETDSGIGLP